MKTVGIIGGMSWESTSTYYRRLNQLINERLGGLHSAEILLASVNFAPIEEMQSRGDWEAAGSALVTKARQLEKAGADCIVIATNTMHKVAPEIEAAVSIPLIHIVDALANHLKKNEIERAGAVVAKRPSRPCFQSVRPRLVGREWRGKSNTQHNN